MKGAINYFNIEQLWGFIREDGKEKDYYFTIWDIPGGSFIRNHIKVEFTEDTKPGSNRAKNIRMLEDE